MKYKKVSPSGSGNIYFGLYTRFMAYDSPQAGSCEDENPFINGCDLNDPELLHTNFVLEDGAWASPGTAWGQTVTDDWYKGQDGFARSRHQ